MTSDRPSRILSQFLASLHTLPEEMRGDEARAIRQGMRLSARDLGLLVGTDPSSIYRWERRGRHEVPRMYALALRALLYERAAQERGEPPFQPKTNNG